MWAKYATPPPAAQLGRRELADGRQELQQDPEPEHHHRRDLDEVKMKNTKNSVSTRACG